MLAGLFPFTIRAAQPPQQREARTFSEEKLERYRQDRDFRYDINPYRTSTFWEKIKHSFYQTIKKIFSDKGAAPYLRTLAIFLFLIFAVVKLSGGQFQWFWGKKHKNHAGLVILPDEEISKTNLLSLAERAYLEGDMRLFVRYHYLHILKELDEKNYISWHKDKTNRDYLREIRSANIRTQFQQQTVIFDYVWYGKFILSQDQVQGVKAGFQRLTESIQNEQKGNANEI